MNSTGISPLAGISMLQGLTTQGGKHVFPWPKGSILDAVVKQPAGSRDFLLLQIGREQIRVKRPDIPIRPGKVLLEVVKNRGMVELRVVSPERMERYVQDMVARVLGDKQIRYEGMGRHLDAKITEFDNNLSIQVYRDSSQDVPYYGLVDRRSGQSRGTLFVESREPLRLYFRVSFERMHTLFIAFTKHADQWMVELFEPSGKFVAELKHMLEEWSRSRNTIFHVYGFLPPWAKLQARTA